jgi:tRNA-2-methylthio-N6-dimethylallyladenosine synthase
VGYDGLYIFKYSPRPKTHAANYTDTVPEEIKTERFLQLQELQNRIQRTRYQRYLGKTVEVLIEGRSARSVDDLTGHTRCHKVVNFPQSDNEFGKLVQVRIDEVMTHSMRGRMVNEVVNG